MQILVYNLIVSGCVIPFDNFNKLYKLFLYSNASFDCFKIDDASIRIYKAFYWYICFYGYFLVTFRRYLLKNMLLSSLCHRLENSFKSNKSFIRNYSWLSLILVLLYIISPNHCSIS